MLSEKIKIDNIEKSICEIEEDIEVVINKITQLKKKPLKNKSIENEILPIIEMIEVLDDKKNDIIKNKSVIIEDYSIKNELEIIDDINEDKTQALFDYNDNSSSDNDCSQKDLFVDKKDASSLVEFNVSDIPDLLIKEQKPIVDENIKKQIIVKVVYHNGETSNFVLKDKESIEKMFNKRSNKQTNLKQTNKNKSNSKNLIKPSGKIKNKFVKIIVSFISIFKRKIK